MSSGKKLNEFFQSPLYHLVRATFFFQRLLSHYLLNRLHARLLLILTASSGKRYEPLMNVTSNSLVARPPSKHHNKAPTLHREGIWRRRILLTAASVACLQFHILTCTAGENRWGISIVDQACPLILSLSADKATKLMKLDIHVIVFFTPV